MKILGTVVPSTLAVDSISLDLVETIIEKAQENEVYMSFFHTAYLEWYYSKIKNMC